MTGVNNEPQGPQVVSEHVCPLVQVHVPKSRAAKQVERLLDVLVSRCCYPMLGLFFANYLLQVAGNRCLGNAAVQPPPVRSQACLSRRAFPARLQRTRSRKIGR